MIDSSTFIQDVVLFIRQALRDNIKHPEGKMNEFIFTAFPTKNTTYPLITIKISGLKLDRLGMTSEVALARLGLEIRIWTKNSKHSDTLTQDVIELLRTLQYGSNSTTDEEIFGFKLNSCIPVVETNGDDTIHSKICDFQYQCVLGNDDE